ncbi:sulfite exporter TauE/SafE family protein [Arenibaculum pallidiluteum]|uniref:sulfite exporter TauE/SafE family protein n=1 Tax=Arenibaculum pallidiluteum TaxID=2812559 RepID=UPI001A973C9A|nr:sulfite exporter TauE/SafE family protein [Arenibaculum pallidiluteum]
MPPIPDLVATALVFVLAGFVKGVIGLGLPTIAIGLLVLVMAPAQAAAVLILPSLATNAWQLAGPGLVPLLRRLWPMMVAIVAGTLGAGTIGAGWLAGDGRLAIGGLGAALAAYGLLGLSGARFSVPARLEPWLSPAVGAATGAITGATGVFVVPAVPYLQALGLGRDALVQALGLSFTVSTVALAASLAGQGAFRLPEAGMSLLALAPALAGMALGRRIRGRIGQRAFRLCFFLGLLALGGHLLLQARS